MSQLLTLELNDQVYIAMVKQAEAAGISLTEWAMVTLQRQSERSSTHDLLSEEEKQGVRERFEKHFGEINLDYPMEVDNESIDADLAREYANNHQEI